MSVKRIIPCLDIKDGRVVKGINFRNLRDAGDPVEIARYYSSQGADEIVLLDIYATQENRKTFVDIVERIVSEVSVPIIVGGGVRSAGDFQVLLQAGASKAAVNSAALTCPELIYQASNKFGSKCVVVAVDAKRSNGGWTVYRNGGQIDMAIDVLEWVSRAQALGAGELLLTSMDADGTKNGFDIELTRAVCDAVKIPVIASGGVGKIEHFFDVFQKTGADAALAATLFHYRELTIGEVKEYLSSFGISVKKAAAV